MRHPLCNVQVNANGSSTKIADFSRVTNRANKIARNSLLGLPLRRQNLTRPQRRPFLKESGGNAGASIGSERDVVLPSSYTSQ